MTRHLLTLAAIPLAVVRVALEIARDGLSDPDAGRLDSWPTACTPARLTHVTTSPRRRGCRKQAA